MKKIHLTILLLLFTSKLYPYNHPEIQWKTVYTDHFAIHYYDKSEPALYPTWKIAEETYATLAPLFNYVNPRRISIGLAEYDDFSNGYALPLNGSVMIWLPELRTEFRNNTTWLRNVITHELGHIMSLQRKFGLQVLLSQASFSFTNPSSIIESSLLFPNQTFFPNWISEGIAQLSAEKLRNDAFDTRREMLLRGSILNKQALTLNEMGVFNHDGRGNEMVYNQGYSIVKFLEQNYGTEKLIRIFKTAKGANYNFNYIFSQEYGISIENVYKAWLDSLTKHYSSVESSLQINITPTKIWHQGLYNTLPKVSPNKTYWGWFSSMKDDFSRSDLVIAPYGSTQPIAIIKYAHTSWDFSQDGKSVFYIKSRSPNMTGSFFNDIYKYEFETGKETRITRDARVYDISTQNRSNEILCVQYVNGAYSLSSYSLETNSFKVIKSALIGDPFLQVTSEPTQKELIITTKLVNGYSRLFLVNTANDSIIQLTSIPGNEESPHVSSDGRIYYSADYSGIYNCYSVRKDGTDLKIHTKTVGGYFTPWVVSEKELLCSHYGKDEFSIVKVQPFSDTTISVDSTRAEFKPLPTPKGKLSISPILYKPIYFSPYSIINYSGYYYSNKPFFDNTPMLDTTELSIGAAFMMYQADALNKKMRALSLGINFFQSNIDTIFDTLANKTTSLIQDFHHNSTNLINSIPRDEISIENVSKDFSLSAIRNSRYNFSDHPYSLSATKGDTVTASSILPIFFPSVSYINSMNAATLSINVGVPLFLIIPVMVQLEASLDFRIAREMYMGLLFPYMQLRFLPVDEMSFTAEMLGYFQWINSSYFRKSTTYTGAGYSSMFLSLGPAFKKGLSINMNSDTVVIDAPSINTYTQMFHSFPLSKNSAFRISEEFRTTHTSEEILDFPGSFSTNDLSLKNISRNYFNSKTDFEYAFPIAKKINKGNRRYADALYGYLGYTLQMKFNDFLFQPDYDRGQPYSFTEYIPNADIFTAGHEIHGKITFGYFLHYDFNSALIADFGYELLREKFFFKVSLGI